MTESLTLEISAGRAVLAGSCTLDGLQAIDRGDLVGLHALPGELTLDLSGITRLDTLGAGMLTDLISARQDADAPLSLIPPPPAQAKLLAAVQDAASKTDPQTGKANPRKTTRQRIEGLGAAALELKAESVELIAFFGALLIGMGAALLRPWRLNWTALVHHMQATGVNALPIVGLLSFLIGIVLAYQGAEQLARFGQEILVVNLLAISILREIGILMTAIIIAGRSGSAFTAQIGTMKVRQEIDAMRVIGLDPMQTLVVPRVLALVLTLPLLGIYASLVGLFGGAVASLMVLGISFDAFIEQLRGAFGPWSFWVGVIKAPVFALIIGMIGCFQGLKVTGSAESVGKLTTKSVVQGIFLVIVIDAIFSIAFQIIGV
ncbi:MAG: MlaE family lipid ABC transporter permease subunit [Alphaproteobacteria bacterium]